jgi:hypothetical protein
VTRPFPRSVVAAVDAGQALFLVDKIVKRRPRASRERDTASDGGPFEPCRQAYVRLGEGDH